MDEASQQIGEGKSDLEIALEIAKEEFLDKLGKVVYYITKTG